MTLKTNSVLAHGRDGVGMWCMQTINERGGRDAGRDWCVKALQMCLLNLECLPLNPLSVLAPMPFPVLWGYMETHWENTAMAVGGQ